jgi:LPS-assembly protein
MKNKFLKIILISLLSFCFFGLAISEEFIFKVSELKVSDSGNIYRGINKGKITTPAGIEITSDNFEYLKKINQLKAYGNAQVSDAVNDMKINAKTILYLKNEEIIYTIGKTFVKISDKYIIEGYDLKLFRNKMILSSLKETIVKDTLDNFYKVNKFEYSINEEILKGNKIEVTTNYEKSNSDKYFFEDGFFDLKKNEFLAKDVEVVFNKKLFGNSQNDPRLKGVTGYGDKDNTYLEKGVFTSCKNTDKCPPWKITAKKVKHNKKSRQIIYKDAWLEMYDIPVVYFPKFFHPDPSVKRQSGFLRPTLGSSSLLGDSVYMPYFHVISKSKDITVKPRLFNYNKFSLQNEYRQKTKNTDTIADFSITKGHNSSLNDKNDNRTHFFANSKINLNLDDYLKSNIELNFEKTSNDNYLKIFNFESPLLKGNISTLETLIKLDLEHQDYDFRTSFAMYETLYGSNSDRYQYVLPSYDFSKNFNFKNMNGSFNFDSSGSNSLTSTNQLTTIAVNNLKYGSYNSFFENGIKSNFAVLLKNFNAVGKKNSEYDSKPSADMTSSYVFNTSLPLIKNTKKNSNILEPKMSFRFSPHKMKDNKNSQTLITMNNIYNDDRLSSNNSFEGRESLTLGVDYRLRKVKIDKIDGIKKIEDYLDFKLARVFRASEENKMPTRSTLNKKKSNIFGQINYKTSDMLSLNYNFSVKNDLDKFEYNSVDATFRFNNLTTTFDYLEERGVVGNKNIITNTSSYRFNSENSLSFKTRRNRNLNLTEYYDMVYRYVNDCLVASVQYNKKFYNDADIKPVEELFFSITIIPFTTFSPDKMFLTDKMLLR